MTDGQTVTNTAKKAKNYDKNHNTDELNCSI